MQTREAQSWHRRKPGTWRVVRSRAWLYPFPSGHDPSMASFLQVGIETRLREPQSQLAPRRDGCAQADAVDADGAGLAKVCGPHEVNSVWGREADPGAVDLPIQAS